MAAFVFNKLSSKEIEAAIVEGNPKSFKKLYILYYPLINKLILSMNGGSTGEDTKDVFQDTLLVLHKNLKEKKVELIKDKNDVLLIRRINTDSTDKSKLSSYLYGIARNIWLNSHQNNINNKEVEYIGVNTYKSHGSNNEPYFSESSPMKWRIIESIKKLSIKCQLIITLKKKIRVSHTELADLLNITHGSCRNLFAGCWKKMMSEIKNIPKNKKETTTSITQYSVFQQRLMKIAYINDIVSFLLDRNSSQVISSKINNTRNHFFELEYKKLPSEQKLLLLLYFVCAENILTITRLLEFKDDKSTENSIYNCTLAFSDRIKKNRKVLEHINNEL